MSLKVNPRIDKKTLAKFGLKPSDPLTAETLLRIDLEVFEAAHPNAQKQLVLVCTCPKRCQKHYSNESRPRRS